MADERKTAGALDRSREMAGEDYEVHRIAGETGLSPDEVRELIDEVGNNREKLMAMALRKAGR